MYQYSYIALAPKRDHPNILSGSKVKNPLGGLSEVVLSQTDPREPSNSMAAPTEP